MAALITVHMGFRAVMGYPSKGLVILFAVRFVEQVAELVWLQNLTSPLSERARRRYAAISVGAGILFAFSASMLSNVQESHYAALMVLPIIVAASSELTLSATLITVAMCGSLTIFQVWYYYDRDPQLTEYYEASTVVLIYLVVALVVHLLVSILRQREQSLERSLHELANTRDRLVEEEKLAAIGRLASSIAHEIRNPVSVISSSLTMARAVSTNLETRDELFDIAEHEAKRMELLTTDLLSYARQKEPDLNVTQLGMTVNYVRDVTQARAAEVGVKIVASCEHDGDIICDSFQIYQALINLIMNAIDASAHGNVVMLSAASIAGTTIFAVVNNGPPIPEQALQRLFEPFFTTKPKGTGLGLAISRKIAQNHGGDLRLTVNGPDRVRFELTIPETTK
ncbi:MAG: HAMP domain-containing histidine kinase [bacterium]|nr:HAMP domain-containing histidine kinase [bacterium]